MSVPYIGSHISLISKSEVRYEGTLYTIDTVNSTVALQNVTSFGTENRCQDRFVAPSNEIYEYIIFRAGDIKDLKVCDPPVMAQQGFQDPAIVSMPAPPQSMVPPPQQQQQQHMAPMPLQQPPATQMPVQQQPPAAAPSNPTVVATNETEKLPGAGKHLTERKPSRSSRGKKKEKLSEFDLSASNAKFDKQKIMGEVAESVRDQDGDDEGALKDNPFGIHIPVAYKKTESFFDSLSSSSSDRLDAQRAAQAKSFRQTDVETFGAAGSNYRPRGWRGRGRGRGGRGRGGSRGGSSRGTPAQ